jgi:hypothetical protein
MDRTKIKETIESMFLTCPYEDRFPKSIVNLLEDNYEDYYSVKGRNKEHPQIRDKEYFSSTGISYFITWLAKTHERKIKNMPVKSKATLFAIVSRTVDLESVRLLHKMIGNDVVDYVNEQRNIHV